MSAHTWRRGGLLRHWGRIMALWSWTSRWWWPAKRGSPGWPTRTPKAGCMPYARTPRGFVRRRRQYCRRPAGIGGYRLGSRRTRTVPPWARRRCKRSLTCSTPSVMTCPGSRGCACHQAWTRSTRTGRRKRRRLWTRSSRISRPWPGAPISCGNETRRRPDSTPRKRLPCYSTSGEWTPTCPPPR